MARALGDRVAHFITINEPWMVAYCGYRWGRHAPGVSDERAAFAAAYHLLLAHGLAWDAIKARTNAQVGIANFGYHPHVLDRDRIDTEWIDYSLLENNAVFLDPIVHGRYPTEVLTRLGANAPTVEEADLRLMHRADFLGIRYYKDQLVNLIPDRPETRYDFLQYTEMGWPVTPVGLYEHLLWLHESYSGVPLVITENGSAWRDVLDPDGRVRDVERQAYLTAHLAEVHRAIGAGVDVRGYFAWSLLDNFEWLCGYRARFGLVYTEFATQARHVKDSGALYRRIIEANGLP